MEAGEDKLGAELRGVTNDGLGCGYDGPAWYLILRQAYRLL